MAKVTTAERMVGGRLFKCEAEHIRRGGQSGKEEIEVRVYERRPGLLLRKKLVRVDYYDGADTHSLHDLIDESMRWVE